LILYIFCTICVCVYLYVLLSRNFTF
jgi:hypothetical protein